MSEDARPSVAGRRHRSATGSRRRQSAASDELASEDREQIAKWMAIWGVPQLATQLRVRFSGRLRRSLGRCRPEAAEIELAGWLSLTPRAVRHEVLCHESAHAAVFVLHGRGCRPHGSEWRALMRRAGFEPRVRLPAEALPPALAEQTAAYLRWLHQCPRCQAARRGRRAMPHWRCATCVSDGHDGRLTIIRIQD